MFAGSTLPQMLTGHSQTTRLQTTVFPMGVVTARLGSKVCTTSLDNLTNIIDTKEWVAPKSNKINSGHPCYSPNCPLSDFSDPKPKFIPLTKLLMPS
jgi:hypothetical protein